MGYGSGPHDRDKRSSSGTIEQAITTSRIMLSTASFRKSPYDPILPERKRTVNIGQLVFTMGRMMGHSHALTKPLDDLIGSTTLNGEEVDTVRQEASTCIRFIGTAYKAGGQTGPNSANFETHLTVNTSGLVGMPVKGVLAYELIYWDMPDVDGDPEAIYADERGRRGSVQNLRRLVPISERKFRSRHNLSKFLPRFYGKTAKDPNSGSSHDRKFATELMRVMVQIGSIYSACVNKLEHIAHENMMEDLYAKGDAGLDELLSAKIEPLEVQAVKYPAAENSFGLFFMRALVNGAGLTDADKNAQAFTTIGAEHAISRLDYVKNIATDYERNHLVGRALADAPESGEGCDSVPVLLANL